MSSLKPININMFSTGRPILTPTYTSNENTLRSFLIAHPNNTNASDIFAKITLIDFVYSTQLKRLIKDDGVHKLSNTLSIINFDSRVQNYDPKLVSEISRVITGINLFSFASKYCSLHNRLIYKKNDYSIYDRVVATLFPMYTRIEKKKNNHIDIVKKTQLEAWRQNVEYDEFNTAIGNFLDSLGVVESQYPDRRNVFDGFIWEQRK